MSSTAEISYLVVDGNPTSPDFETVLEVLGTELVTRNWGTATRVHLRNCRTDEIMRMWASTFTTIREFRALPLDQVSQDRKDARDRFDTQITDTRTGETWNTAGTAYGPNGITAIGVWVEDGIASDHVMIPMGDLLHRPYLTSDPAPVHFREHLIQSTESWYVYRVLGSDVINGKPGLWIVATNQGASVEFHTHLFHHFRALCDHGYTQNDSCPGCDHAHEVAEMCGISDAEYADAQRIVSGARSTTVQIAPSLAEHATARRFLAAAERTIDSRAAHMAAERDLGRAVQLIRDLVALADDIGSRARGAVRRANQFLSEVDPT